MLWDEVTLTNPLAWVLLVVGTLSHGHQTFTCLQLSIVRDCWVFTFIISNIPCDSFAWWHSAGVCLQCTGLWRLALAGGIAGCCFWTAMFPTDVVKSRIQVRQCWVHVFSMCSKCAQHVLSMCMVYLRTALGCNVVRLPLLELPLSTTRNGNHCQSVSDAVFFI